MRRQVIELEKYRERKARRTGTRLVDRLRKPAVIALAFASTLVIPADTSGRLRDIPKPVPIEVPGCPIGFPIEPLKLMFEDSHGRPVEVEAKKTTAAAVRLTRALVETLKGNDDFLRNQLPALLDSSSNFIAFEGPLNNSYFVDFEGVDYVNNGVKCTPIFPNSDIHYQEIFDRKTRKLIGTELTMHLGPNGLTGIENNVRFINRQLVEIAQANFRDDLNWIEGGSQLGGSIQGETNKHSVINGSIVSELIEAEGYRTGVYRKTHKFEYNPGVPSPRF